MRKYGLLGLALAVPGALVAIGSAGAADSSTSTSSPNFGALGQTPVPKGKKAPVNCKAPDSPYKNYDCLDAYLGDGFFERLVNYYRLEIGHEVAPADPKAPLPPTHPRRCHFPSGPTAARPRSA